jgi:hypothetical protein
LTHLAHQACQTHLTTVHLLLLGGSADDRHRAVRRHVPDTYNTLVLDAGTLPFTRPEAIGLPPSPRALVVDDLELAFPDHQAGGTRLVLTQSTYVMQKWIDRLDAGDRIVATADRAALERCAPEIFQARGCWGAFEVRDLGSGIGDQGSGVGAADVSSGTAHRSTWHLGTWHLGTWHPGTWHLGTWHPGTYHPVLYL